MVYGIVKSHGGHIMCYSEVGRGTTIKVYLPAIRSAAGPALSAEAVKDDIRGGSETILLVDDEGSLRDLGRQMLIRKGYRVLLAATGEEALAVYGKSGADIDLVILDINMPGMGGQKCLQELLARNPELKVLIASGYTANAMADQTLKEGAKGFIAKPFKRNNLLNTVRDILDSPLSDD
jgi:DNA-binding NtrC family response regulator